MASDFKFSGLKFLRLVAQHNVAYLNFSNTVAAKNAAELEPRFAAVVISNGFLPSGNLPGGGVKGLLNGGAFLTWRTFARFTPVFPTAALLSFGIA